MLIRKKLTLVVFFSLAVAVAMAATIFHTTERTEKAGRLNRLSSDLTKELIELRLDTFDAIFYPGRFTVRKWREKEEFISKSIEAGMAVQTEDTREIFGRMQRNIHRVRRRFEELVSLKEEGRSKEILNELRNRLVGQILARSQLIVSDAALIDQIAVDSELALQHLQERLLYALLLLMSGGLALMVFCVNKGLMGSLHRLAKGARFIARGDLEHKIEVRGDDEIGEVGKDFNAMAAALKDMLVSLQRSEENLRLIIDSSPIAVTAVDKEKDVTLWNPAAQRIFGWQNEEVIGRPLPIIPDSMRDGYRKMLEDVMNGGGITTSGTSFLCKNGLPVEVSLFAAPLKDAGGKAVGVLTLIEDISERKKAEEALRKSEVRFRSTLDNMMEGCQLIGFDWRYLYVNKVAAEHGRRSREELIGSSMPEIYPGVETTTMFAALKRCLEDRLPTQMENEFVYPDGGRAWFQLAVQPVPEGAFVLSIDITERKRTEKELRLHREHLEEMVKERTAELQQSGLALMNMVEDLNRKTFDLEKANARLKEMDRLKSIFIASMSHELRTPLNSVIGFSSILLDEWVGPLNDEQKENLDTILRSGKHLLSLINDVIDVSKVEAGAIDPSITAFDVYDVVAEAASSFRKECSDKGLDLQVESVHHGMQTDRRRLLQCLLNLLSNAVKFSQQGSIRVAARTKTNEREDGPVCIEIIVEDTGIGIEEANIPKLFSAFTRLDSPLKAVAPGTGLGLYLTKKLVKEVLKGEIEVASAVGKGSTFILTVPAGGTFTYLGGRDEENPCH
jgi:PAS domain S-box-containing protein